jgi:hypothetical protein
LAELQHRLYDATPRETLEEVVPYPVSFDPFTPVGAKIGAEHFEAVLVDCDGRVANDLLSRRRALTASSGERTLAGAILEADTLILVIDASAPTAQIEADFDEFGRFLRLLKQNRGQRTEVGGMPVFLVLTKCDLLAHANDTPAGWMECIEQRKRDLDRRFQEFLAQQKKAGPLPFGSIDLHLWATAVKRPALAGSPARPREPYGIAELFRQSLEYGQDFRRRQGRSARRLLWTVTGSSGVVLAMVALTAVLLANRQEKIVNPLADKVSSYRVTEGSTPSARLRGPLQRQLAELKELQNQPGFEQLSSEDQDYVRGRIQELQDYIDYRERLLQVRLPYAANETELNRAEKQLREELVLPSRYENEWAQTEAAQLRERLLKDAQALRVVLQWYRRKINDVGEWLSFANSKPTDAPSWEEWLKQVDELLNATFPPPQGEEAKYDAVLRFDGVAAAAKELDTAQQPLRRLRDLVAALGLAGRLPDGTRQPLDIPDRCTLAQVENHVQKLEKRYPGLMKEVAATELPEAIAEELRRRARTSYDHLLEPGRETVLARLQEANAEGQETLAGWRRLRPWLVDPVELRDWRILARPLVRLQDPQAKDPVDVLADFLRQDQFDVGLRNLKLEVPFDRKLRPVGPITVYFGSGNDEIKPAVVLTRDDEGHRDFQKRITTYKFQRESGSLIVYRPGDHLFATLPVRKENEGGDWLLTWARNRSELYQFERLVRPPRLHRKEQENTQGELMENISLTVVPERDLPRVPDLVPVVKLKKN